MIVRNNSECPSLDELSYLLDPHHPPTPALNQHLDRCSQCRELLCSLAGDPQCWEEAADILATPSVEARLAPAICALSSAVPSLRIDDSLCDYELRQLQSLLAPASHPELIGRIGRYELEQLVGRGGMGLVFRARDVELQRVVAVKTLAIHLIPIGAARARFVREARATASLSHPHIVPVYDVITDGAVPAIVMQFIAGPTLEKRLAEAGPLAWQDVLQLGIQLCDALTIAHDHGLVHRDIKPGNVNLEAYGSRALLTDFGLVRALDDATVTRSGMLAGTPDYMSPEQAHGQSVSTSCDLFSLGSLLYAMLTGHPPFRAETPMAVMNRICHHRHRPLCEVNAEVPLEISQLIDRLLAKAPRKRFATAADVGQRLRELACARHRLCRGGRGRKKRFAPLLILLLALGGSAWLGVSQAPEYSQPSHTARLLDSPPGTQISPESMSDSLLTNTPSPGSRLDIGFTELHALDEQIDQLSRDTVQLQRAADRTSFIEFAPGAPMFPLSDQALEDLISDLERLTQEFHSPP